MINEQLLKKMTSEIENVQITHHRYSLNHYKEMYLLCKRQMMLKCSICFELEHAELPYDCLQTPNYCVRKPIFNQFITAYENYELQLQILKN